MFEIVHFPVSSSSTALQIESTVLSAAKYSGSDFNRLVTMLEKPGNKELAQHLQILKLHLDYLAQKSYAYDPHQFRTELFAQTLLRGILAIMFSLGPSMLNDPYTFFVQDFTRSWPDIWRWIKSTFIPKWT
jgi:hypothetical protein